LATKEMRLSPFPFRSEALIQKSSGDSPLTNCSSNIASGNCSRWCSGGIGN
jgi:hypothetical protein